MKLVVGLGNPGKKYERTRHNLGFMIVDQIARRHQVTIKKKLSDALVEISKDPETQAKLRRIGFEPIGKDAAAFQEFFRADVKKWTEFVKERGLKETQ